MFRSIYLSQKGWMKLLSADQHSPTEQSEKNKTEVSSLTDTENCWGKENWKIWGIGEEKLQTWAHPQLLLHSAFAGAWEPQHKSGRGLEQRERKQPRFGKGLGRASSIQPASPWESGQIPGLFRTRVLRCKWKHCLWKAECFFLTLVRLRLEFSTHWGRDLQYTLGIFGCCWKCRSEINQRKNETY